MSKATRAAYGETLNELIAEGLDIVVVEADLSGSTTTNKVEKEHPKRFFNAGIAEQNMTNVAAGLSLTGRIAFTGSFAIFGTGRAYEQVRNTVCYNNLDVKIAPTHAGVTVGPDGGSHQMIEDLALMRVLPNMKVIVPCDFNQAKAAIRTAALTPGPVYVRLGRAGVAEVYGADCKVELGKANVLREGSDVTIAACGLEVQEALKAADILAEQGVSAEVLDMVSIKPIDVDTLVASVAKTDCIVTAEEHSVHGGLGSAISEVLSELRPTVTRRIGVADRFGTSGSPDELLKFFNLDADSIVEAALEVIAAKA